MADLTKYKRAGYPAIALETYEPQRIIDTLLSTYPDKQVFTIAATGGLKDARARSVTDPQATYPKALQFISATDQAFLVMLDWQHVSNNAPAYRALIDSLDACKARGSMIVLLAPSWTLPAELQHEIPVLHDELPQASEFAPALETIIEARSVAGRPVELSDDEKQALLVSARGLTRNEAENAFALAAGNGLNAHAVETEKMRLVKSACLTVERPAPIASLGGLGVLKRTMTDEVLPARDARPHSTSSAQQWPRNWPTCTTPGP